jgi:hypothetical protein
MRPEMSHLALPPDHASRHPRCARLKQRLRVESYGSEAEATEVARRIAAVMESAA